MTFFGIDLGTTNSAVSYAREGDNEVKMILAPNGSKTIPSIVKMTDEGITVGPSVQKEYDLGAMSTKGSFKVDMGSDVKYDVGGFQSNPEKLSAEVLKYLKSYTEEYLGEPMNEAVITVPAYFTEIQRQATERAANEAGIKVARMINEPTACALAYGLSLDEEKTVLVYDLGGGTFDVSALQFSNGLVEVLNTVGDPNLGGDDFDKAIYKEVESKLASALDYIPSTIEAKKVLQLLCRRAKEALSEQEEVGIDLTVLKSVDPKFTADVETLNLTRKAVYKYVKPLLDITVNIVKECLDELGGETRVDEILLTGGSTRLFCLADYVAANTGMKVNKGGVDPDLSISIGATIQHQIMGGKTDVILLDVTPFDLSVEVAEGLCSVIINRNSNIPIKKTREYTTDKDFVDSLVFNIVQGNEPLAKNNTSLGQIIIPISEPLPAGIHIFKVTYALDSNGTLKVTAVNEATGEKETVTRKL